MKTIRNLSLAALAMTAVAAPSAHGHTPVAGANGTIYTGGERPGSRTPDLFSLAPGAAGLTQLFPDGSPAGDFQPAPSPSGDAIVFSSRTNGPGGLDIVRASPGGSGRISLTGPGADTDPAWSPDGTRIAFSTDRPGSLGHDIWVMGADGSNPVNLTHAAGRDSNPACSPDGSRILFASDRPGARGTDVFAMHADGSGPVNLTHRAGVDTSPAWAPDGSRIVYLSYGPLSPSGDLFVASPDGSRAVDITNANGTEATPVWSPDGRSIAYAAPSEFGGADMDLWTIGADGSGARRLAGGPGAQGPYAWLIDPAGPATAVAVPAPRTTKRRAVRVAASARLVPGHATVALRLLTPAGTPVDVNRCQGTVSVVARAGRRVERTAEPMTGSVTSCVWALGMDAPRARRVRLTVRFSGNGVLAPAKQTLTVRPR